MTEVPITVRLNKNEILMLRDYEDRFKDRSTVVRELIRNGRIFSAIEKYKHKKLSLGRAAELSGLSLSEFIDTLADLGIETNITKKDLMEGYKTAKKFFT